jgi:hypothetical protein
MNLHSEIALLLVSSQVVLFLVLIAVLRVLVNKKVKFSFISVGVKCALLGNIPVLLATYLLLRGNEVMGHEMGSAMIYVLITYNALAYSYYHLLNMSETGRRIRILHELNLTGRLRYDELARRYGAEDMLDVRLERLVNMNQVTKHNGRYLLKSSVLYQIGILVLSWGFFLGYNMDLRNKLSG